MEIKVRVKVGFDGFIEYKDHMGSDADIADAARVSYKGNGKSTDRDLIRYLVRNLHLSPTEMGVMKFHVRLPLYIVQQILRHRLFSINQISYRYTEIDDVMEKTEPDKWRLQSKDNKQGSNGYLTEWPEHTEFSPTGYFKNYDIHLSTGDICCVNASELESPNTLLKSREIELQELSKTVYEERIKLGVAREQARKDIPVSTYTEFYWMGNLRTIFNFLSLRCDYHAQEEIREFADKLAGFVKLHFPLAFQAWEDYDFHASTLTRLDKKLLQLLHINATVYILLEANILLQDSWSAEQLEEMRLEVGMTKREFDEFWNKFNYTEKDFTLESTNER